MENDLLRLRSFLRGIQKFERLEIQSEKRYTRNISAVASSIMGGGGAHIHIFVFTDHKNNRFQKKLITQNTNI